MGAFKKTLPLLILLSALQFTYGQSVAQEGDGLQSTRQINFHIVEAVYSQDGTPIPIEVLIAPPEPGLLEQLIVTSTWLILTISIAFAISYIIRYYTNKNLKSYIGTLGFLSAGYFIIEHFMPLLPYNLALDKFIVLTGLSFVGAVFAHIAHYWFPRYLPKFMPSIV